MRTNTRIFSVTTSIKLISFVHTDVSATTFHILFLSLILMDFSQASFNISEGRFSWSEAGLKCTLATPMLTAANHSTSVYSVDNLGIDIPENEEIWAGYYQVVRVFEYIGCVKQRDLLHILPSDYVNIQEEPGQCFPRCGDSTIVGVTKTRCYCFGDTLNFTVDTMQTECTYRCNHPQVACGFDRNEEYSFLSIYKINPAVDHSAIKDSKSTYPGLEKNCLCYSRTLPRSHSWENCKASLLVMCNNGQDILTIPGVTHSNYSTWIDAANRCFGKRYSPTNYSNSRLVHRGEGAQLWTGCFKTLVAYKYNATIPDERRHDQKLHGYIYKETPTQVKLKFADSNSNPTKRVLCWQGRNGDTGQTTSKETSISTPSSLSNTSSTTDASENGVYIAIGASAAALVFVAAIIVLLLLFLKRRQQKVSKQCKNNKEIDQGAENDYTCPNLAAPDSSQNSNYFILQPQEKEAENENLTYDTTDENTTYDTTEADRDYGIVKTDTVYNRLDIGKDQTYDHTLAQKKDKAVQLKDKSHDDIYDSAVPENKATDYVHTDNIYNTTDDENVYNHFGDKPIQTVTDNVYGIQG